ncbi:MAG: menaquinone biosynthesis protein [Bacteroidales bacterium]
METYKTRVTAVSYLNTIPFIYGLKYFPGISDSIELQLLPPAFCADAFRRGESDLALVPVGAMTEADLEKLCCNWCLGADGPVDTVLLLSDDPLEKINTIYLDKESRTSVLLVQMLSRYYWEISPEFKPWDPSGGHRLASGEALLLIGDKTFGVRSSFRHSWDLAENWQKMTGLPAVFACWLMTDHIDPVKKELINDALAWGLNHIDEAIRQLGNPEMDFTVMKRYLTKCISFQLDEPKRAAISKFFGYLKRL